MPKYDHEMSHAQTALRECRDGKYSNEVISFALDLTYLTKSKPKRYFEQVCIITNQSVIMIKQIKSLKVHIPLRKIRGMMVYYYRHLPT